MKRRVLSVILALTFVFQVCIPFVTVTATDVQDSYVWDLTDLFASDEECIRRANELVMEIYALVSYKGRLNDRQIHVQFIQDDKKVSDDIMRVYYYGYLKYAKCVTDEAGRELYSKGVDLMTLYNTTIEFYTYDICALEQEELYEIINDDRFIGKRSFYTRIYNDWTYYHYFYNQSEANIIYNKLTPLFESGNIYEVLTMGEMEYNEAAYSNGNYYEVDRAMLPVFLGADDQQIRKNGYNAYYSSFGKYRNTLSALYSNNVKVNYAIAEINGFNSVLNFKLYENKLTDRAFKKMKVNLIAGAPEFKKSYDVIARLSGNEKLYDYDMAYYNPVTIPEDEYTIDNAKEDIINALSPLGEEYIFNIKRAFEDGWIDAYTTDGKLTGAFAVNTPEHPYVLINAEGSVEDGITLAHELGHAMHMLFTSKNCVGETDTTDLTTTETAAMVNEMLFLKYKLDQAQTKEEKMYYSYRLVCNMRDSGYVQLLYTEFEEKTHKEVEFGNVLSASFLEKTWFELEKEYCGTDYIEVSDVKKYAWSMIPHFYTDFYCMNYCFAAVAAANAVDFIKTEGGTQKYIEFISSGTKQEPSELLKIIGIDIEADEAYQQFMAMFSTYLDMFEAIEASEE